MKNANLLFDPSPYTYELGVLEKQDVIWITFPYDFKRKEILKKELKARWNPEYKKWYVPDIKRFRDLFTLPPKYFTTALYSKVDENNRKALDHYVQQLILSGYSPNTIKTYSQEFIQLLVLLKSFPVNELTPERLRSYFLYCIQKLRLSENLIHSRMNAVKFYFEKVLKKERFFLDIPRPQKPSLLPKAVSTQTIKKILKLTTNLKHRVMLKLCYGMGLRVSEVVNLRISDIDSERMQVLIQRGKGKKDRYVVLPESVLSDLRKYYAQSKPKDFLFEGQHGGQYSVRSVQQVFHAALKKAGINNKVGIHSLRHSYATHLIEHGTDIRFVQDLLGHQSVKTTMRYTALTDATKRKIKSPLDHL